MANRIQIRRGTNANRLLLNGTTDIKVGELLFATDTKRVFIGDGSTNGGYDFIGNTISTADIAYSQINGGTQNALITFDGSGDAVLVTGSANEVLTLNGSGVPDFAGITPTNVASGYFITDLSVAPAANRFVDAATVRSYVLSQVNGLSWRPPVDFIDTTTTNPATTVVGQTAFSPDGVAVVNGDRVLFQAATNATYQDRVFVVGGVGTSITLTLATDGQAGTGAPTDGDTIFVERGTANADKTFNYNGTDWILIASLTGALLAANNLSDVANAATALSNIGGVGPATTHTLTNKTIDDDNNILSVDYTSIKDETAGDLFYWTTGGVASRLAIGTSNQLLTVVGGLPVWQSFSTTFPNVVTNAGTSSDNEIARFDGTTGKIIQNGTVARLNDNTTIGGDTLAPLDGVHLDGGTV